MSLLCPDCLVYGVWEAGKTTRECATPISTSDPGKVAPDGQHRYDHKDDDKEAQSLTRPVKLITKNIILYEDKDDNSATVISCNIFNYTPTCTVYPECNTVTYK